MKSLLLAITLVAFAAISCDTSETPTATSNSASEFSKAVVEKDIPIDFGCYEICGESGCCVCLTGTARVVDNGNSTHIKYQLTGEGYDCETGEPNGVKYVGSATINVNNANGYPATQSVNINSNGPGCNFQAHVTINANGEITVEDLGCDE